MHGVLNRYLLLNMFYTIIKMFYTQRQVGLVSTGAQGTQYGSTAKDVLHPATGTPGVDRSSGYSIGIYY